MALSPTRQRPIRKWPASAIVPTARLYQGRRFGASFPRGKAPLSFDRVNRKYTSKQLKAAPNGNKRFVQIAEHQSILRRSMMDQRFTAFAWALCANGTNLRPKCSTGFARPNIGSTISGPYQRLKGNANSTAMMVHCDDSLWPIAEIPSCAVYVRFRG